MTPGPAGVTGRAITARRPQDRRTRIRRFLTAAALAVGLLLVAPVYANAAHHGTCQSHRCLRHARYLCHKHPTCRDRVAIAHMGIRGIGLQLLIDQHRRNAWPCLDYVVFHESGWDPHAVNPSSGAAGLAQSLGHGYVDLNDPRAQLIWMLHYEDDRYGGPCAAMAFWMAHHYY